MFSLYFVRKYRKRGLTHHYVRIYTAGYGLGVFQRVEWTGWRWVRVGKPVLHALASFHTEV